MAKPYSNGLRARVIEAIDEGATREEAAERHHVSLSSVGRFLRLKRERGSVSPAQFGGYKPYALAAHEDLVRHVLARGGLLRFVRRLHGYYGGARLLVPVHHRLRLLAFPMRTAVLGTQHATAAVKQEISQLPTRSFCA